MAAPSLTYTLTNGTTADASQVMQNFNDLLNGITDATKDLSISALTVAGTATLNGNVALGNASGDDITHTGSLASSIPIKTTNTYDIGSADLGLRAVYFGTADADTAKLVSAALAADRVYTMPDAGADADFVMTAGTQTIAGAKTFSTAINVSGSTTGITVESARTSPAASDTQNIYSCTWTPATPTSNPSRTGAATGGSSAVTAFLCSAVRVGAFFVASIHIQFTSNGTGTYTFGIGLPETGANFATTSAAGCLVGDPSATQLNFARIKPETSNNVLTVEGYAGAALSSVDFYGTVLWKA